MPKKLFGFPGGAPTCHTSVPYRSANVFWIPLMGVIEVHNAKKYCFRSGVAPQTPIPRYPIGQQKCFWISMMELSELHHAKKHSLGSWVAPKTSLPLYPVGQQSCFCILMMGVFGLHSAKKIGCVLGWRPKHPYLCTL